MAEIYELFKAAKSAVLSGGRLLLDRSRSLSSWMKGPDDFVTQTDIDVQRLIRDELEGAWGEIGFMGEEDSCHGESGKVRWILDPVDGTSNLMHGYRHSAVSLALVDGAQPEIGIVYDPFAGELFTSIRGRGAFMNGEPIHVSGQTQLRLCNISFGASPGDRGRAEEVFALAGEMYKRCHDLRRIGSAALELCYVAAGRQDGYYEFRLKPWDVAAGALIVEEAGGVALTPQGRRLDFDGPCDILASGKHIWQELAAIIAGCAGDNGKGR